MQTIMKTRKLKRKLALFVAVIMTLTLWTAAPLQASAETTDDGFVYRLVVPAEGETTATITGYTGTDIDIDVPPVVGDGIAVTAIAADTFGSYSVPNAALKTVTIPTSVISIDPGAFAYARALTAITVTEGNQNYSDENGVLLTQDKESLVRYPAGGSSEYTVPDSVTSIRYNAFLASRTLKTVTMENVETIGNSAFNACVSLETVAMNDSVESIGTWAFAYCNKLVTVEMSESVTSIGSSTFMGCTALETVALDKVNTIGGSAFLDCTSLKSIAIPTVVTIGEAAFQNSGLTSVAVPSTVTSMGVSAFRNCKALISATVENNTITRYMFAGCTSLQTITMSNVTSIGTYAFQSCGSLNNITIPAGVTVLDDLTFANCTSLTSIEIPATVTSINTGVFKDSGLINVVINSAATIGYEVFSGCTSLETVTMDNVTTIRDNTFEGCTSLTTFTVNNSDNTAFQTIDGVLFNKAGTSLMRYPLGKGGAYTVPNTVTSIGANTFAGSTVLTSVTLPDSISSIGANAFGGCTALEDVVILKTGAGYTPSATAFANCDFENLTLWCYSDNTSIPSFVVGKGAADIDNGNIKYRYLLNHIAIDETLRLNNGASATLDVGYFATADTDEAKDALVEIPAVTWSASEHQPDSHDGQPVVEVNPVTGKITALQDGTATITATVIGGEMLNPDADIEPVECDVTVETATATITSFTLEGIPADINYGDPNTITVELPAGTDLTTSLTPVIVHNGAGTTPIAPAADAAQDFTDDVSYTVTALDNSTSTTYTVIVTVPQITPVAAINYVDETLTGLIAGEKYTFNGTQETVSGTTREIDPEWFGTELSIVRKGNGARIVDSAAQLLTIPAKPDAPEGITTEGETIVGKNNGVIYGIATDMEYRKVEDNQAANEGWIDPGVDDEVGDLAAGDYQVRVKQDGNNFAGIPVTVNIAAGVAQTRILTVTAPAFTDVTAGYARPDAEAIVIANSGNSTANISDVTVSGTAFEIGGEGATVDPSDEIETWTIQPKAGLSADTYNATITVTYDGTAQTTATTNVSFKVNAVVIPPPPAAETYALTVTGGTDNTNAGPYEEGTPVSIIAGTAPEGQVFDTWTSSNGGSFADATSATTTFTMPANAVTVTATYKDDPNAGNGEPGDDNPPDNPPQADNGWVKNDDGEWEYLTGGEAKTGWLYDTNYKAWYYLASDGVMQTGWDYVGGKWYYLASNGKMQTGWLKDNGNWYYLSGDGAMVVNKWFKDTDGSWYYLSGNGKMLTGKQNIGGKAYTFKSNGVWVS